MKAALIRKFGRQRGATIFYRMEAKGKIPGARKRTRRRKT